MNICILYGGRSGEHEISLRSAASVVKNLDPSRYTVAAIGIDKAGRWHLQEELRLLEVPGQGSVLSIVPASTTVSVVPSDGFHAAGGKKLAIDCVFPVLHGSFGEDGTVQGLLEIAGLPYVGAGVPGSSISMDKETAKRLWRDAGLPIVDFQAVDRSSTAKELREAAGRIGWPVFVKPCSAGSSLGASRVNDESQLDSAVAQALRYDTRALLERCVDGREIECAVIGNSRPRAFPPGEIVPSRAHDFYDYDAKYTDQDGASLEAAARVDEPVRKRIMRAAESAYAAVRCEGMARVDFFLERRTGELFVNEINTIPGFTSISMFPRMCEASGLPYAQLLDTLVELALARDAEKKTVRYEK
jgi:D-alanine-D-alanine ligase